MSEDYLKTDKDKISGAVEVFEANKSKKDYENIDTQIKKYLYYDRKEYNAYKNYIRIISVSLIIVSLFLASLIYENGKSEEYKNLLNNSYDKSFTEITEALDNIGNSFEKISLYTDAGEMATTFGIIYKEIGNIESSLDDLPYDQTITNNIAKFLNQVQDFSHMMLDKGIQDEEVTRDDYEIIETLKNYSEIFTNELSSISMSLLDGDKIDWQKISNETNDKFMVNDDASNEKYENDESIMASSINVIDESNSEVNTNETDNNGEENAIEESTKNAYGSLLGLSSKFSNYPSLKYSGKYSDEYVKVQSNFLNAKNEITQDEASEIAKNFVGVNNISNMKFNTLVEGDIPYYSFDITMKNSSSKKDVDNANIAISKRGGIVLWFYDYSEKYDTKEYQISSNMREETSYIEVRRIAEEYLKKSGYDDVVLVSSNEEYNNIALTYAREENGVIYYADAIILKISLVSMKVTGFNSTFYVMTNKSERNLSVKISESDARNTLKSGFLVKETKKVMLTLDSKEEVLCYEFLGEYDGNEYLIYVNATNGRKERIDKVSRNESGMIIGDTYY